MEDILDLYAEPYDAQYPLVCFDESPYQLVSEVRQPQPLAPGQPVRYDYQYPQEGSCNLCMFFEPLQGWRHLKSTDRRTAQDFAYCMKDLVDIHFPQATVISVVLDKLNTHTLRRCRRRFRRPKPVASSGSWISTIPPSLAVGSTWRNSSSPW
jgi:hypothetical protein